MLLRFARATGLALLVAAPLAAAQAQSGAPADDPVVATVNGSAIHRSEIVRARQALPDQYRSLPLEMLYGVLLERVIGGKLLALEGRKLKLQDRPDVRREIEQLADLVIREAYIQKRIEDEITEAAVREHYKKLIDAMPPEDEVRARHILLESEEEAKAVIEELNGGADFAELAKARSKGPSAERGGDLDYFRRGDMISDFADAAFALKVGEFTETPVKTQFGWHVIKVEDRRPAKPPTFEEAQQNIVSQMSDQLISSVVQELEASATIERFNLDGSPRTEKSKAPEGKTSE